MGTNFTVTDPQISVQRDIKQIAVFDMFVCIRPFQTYTDEAAAIEEAKKWLKRHTDKEPQILYPRIKSVRYSY